MHFKDFYNNPFYQRPYIIFDPNNQQLFPNYKRQANIERLKAKRYSKYSKDREPDEKCQGKYIKHIFKALKNKTSSELAAFINVNSEEYEISSHTLNQQSNKVLVPSVFDTYAIKANGKKADEDIFSSENSSNNTQESTGTVSDPIINAETNRVDKDLEVEKSRYYKLNRKVDKSRPYPEIYEEKVSEKSCFLTRVFSIFKTKREKPAGCNCDMTKRNPKDVEPLYENDKYKDSESVTKAKTTSPPTDKKKTTCKCSATVIKLDKTFLDEDKTKCNNLSKYKCERCGKLNLEKLDNRCPNLKLDEDALMFLLKLEAKQNYKQIKSIQKQLDGHNSKLAGLEEKYLNIIKIIAPEKVTPESTDVTDASTNTRLEDEQPPEAPDSCMCATNKKSSFFVRIFKKPKCHQACKCCLTEVTDKKKCKYYSAKKDKKKDKENDNGKDKKKKDR